MPLSITQSAGGVVHPNPFIGPIQKTVALRVDVSALDGTGTVDANGYLKPGTIMQQNGVIVNGVTQIAYGAVVEAVKVAASNATADLAAAADIDVAVALGVLINRDIWEDMMGRVMNANELAAVDVAGSHVAVTPT